MSDCLFDYHGVRDGRHLWVCSRCGRPHLSRYDDAKFINRNCTDDKPPATEGPGTELKNMLAVLGIKPTRSCDCDRHAMEMNERGADWCEENIETIVGWLREAAAKLGLPFSAMLARSIVRKAIKRRRKKLAASD